MHIIYHIPGIKIGCTKNLKERFKLYHPDTKYEILELLENKTDQEAGDIEWQYADKYGYKRGPHYTLSIANTSIAGRKGGLSNTSEQHSIAGKTTAKKYFDKEHQSRVARIDYACPHCSVTGKGRAMFRWHFDNCVMGPNRFRQSTESS